MSISLFAASIYWVIVALWLTVLGTIAVFYIRNPRIFGTTRLLLAVVAIDTLRNIIENVYFGFYFGAQYGLFPAGIIGVLGNPALLIIPKIVNVTAGGVVLALLLHRWLPSAVREREKSEQVAIDLASLTSIDALTGLYNRNQFESLGRAEWDRVQRYLQPISILIVDLDQFKEVNSRFGHDTGDRLVKCVATACTMTARTSDIVARTDVQELSVLLPHTDAAEARFAAEQLRDAVLESFLIVGDETLHPTVCIGVATSTFSMSGIEALIKRADGALHEARRGGGNRVTTAAGRIDESLLVTAQ
jgi:diguanylate cyclase (GGDEF)-like protein